jgi:GTP-binding protein HflX
VHVVDISHKNFEEHIRVVNETLTDIGAIDKPILIVFNKIDAYIFVAKEEDDLTPLQRENISLHEFKSLWVAKENLTSVFISALNKNNIQELRAILSGLVKQMHYKRYPNNLKFQIEDYGDLD